MKLPSTTTTTSLYRRVDIATIVLLILLSSVDAIRFVPNRAISTVVVSSTMQKKAKQQQAVARKDHYDNSYLFQKIARGGGGGGEGGGDETEKEASTGGEDGSSSSTSSDTGTTATNSSEVLPSSDDLAMKSVKWNGLRNRIVSTIGIVASLVGLSYYFREDGLLIFVIVLQIFMYREMTRTIGGVADSGSGGIGANSVQNYLWLVTATIAWNGPKLYPWKRHTIEAITYGIVLLNGLITSILGFQYKKQGRIEFREYIRQTAVSVLSAILVVLPSSYWIGTLEEYGMQWIYFPATFVAINDIMAYVFGKLFGKHPLLSYISPNKTWEGFIGAAVATTGTAWLTLDGGNGSGSVLPFAGRSLKFLTDVSRFDGMVLAIFSSLIAPFAGFLASVIKRAYGRKDFGTLIPGHGGIVDRLDCQLILAPFVYLYLSLFKFTATTTTKG